MFSLKIEASRAQASVKPTEATVQKVNYDSPVSSVLILTANIDPH